MRNACVRLVVLGLALGAVVPATADEARVTLKAGQLTISNTAVSVVRENPLELDLALSVVAQP